MEIKPIETVYNGYRFRSRLEARWAVFFDALGIKYEYEKEGFDLGEAGRYLPDFWLPELECWIEIKGQAPTPEEIKKARAMEGQKWPIGIFWGLPGENYGWVFCCDSGGAGGGISDWDEVEWAYSDQRGAICLAAYDTCEDRCYRDFDFELWLHMEQSSEVIKNTPRILAAFAAARQARFEHGEKPNAR